MSTIPLLPIEEILAPTATAATAPGLAIGRSREGRELAASRFGHGSLRISLIGGCHADEPVGPEMLDKLAAHLAGLPRDHPLLEEVTWSIVPHVNPDGAERNAAWTGSTVPLRDHLGEPDVGFELRSYLRSVVRELPGDDIEFGFPRDTEDGDARPENRAVADFLRDQAPLHLHATFHGMGRAPGPWFLIEHDWASRTADLRDNLRERVRAMGYRCFDIDRGGEKGFHRIDEGFSSRPDSRAMTAHFEAAGDPETAALFRPSSMEMVRALGGDPFTFVSEMPLFLLPEGGLPTGSPTEDALAQPGVRSMPIRDQMRLQLAFLNEAVAAVVAWRAER